MKLFATAALAALLTLTGCAASVKRADNESALAVDPAARKNIIVSFDGSPTARKSDNWESFKGAWRDAFTAQAAEANAQIAFVDGAPKPSTAPATLVSIYVDDYRYISAGARYGFGIFTGNAFVDSKARFKDARTDKLYGERTFNTSSTAWQGVFSAMTDKQLNAISKEILSDIQGRR